MVASHNPFGQTFCAVRKIAYGVITSFSGAIGNIPPGWSLCDGSDGTPDLRDKFVPGAGSSFAVGNEGGAVNHTHGFTGDGHSHNLAAGSDIIEAGDKDLPISTQPASGTTDNGDVRPPYYSLAYIMYID